MFKVFAADRQFGKHLLRGTWEPFDSYIFMCSDTQRYVMLGPLFSHFPPLFLFSFASFLVLWGLPFSLLSPACLLKQIQAHLLWWSLCLELKIAPQEQEIIYIYKKKRQECKQHNFCCMALLFFWGFMHFNKIKIIAALCLHGVSHLSTDTCL